jgi:cation diffusion facilitator family transporter
MDSGSGDRSDSINDGYGFERRRNDSRARDQAASTSVGARRARDSLPLPTAIRSGLHDGCIFTLLRQPTNCSRARHEMIPAKHFPRLSSRSVLFASIAADLLIGLTKFAAAFFTRSSAMLSEGIHSIVDTGNGILVLYGLRRAAVLPDHEHPFGHGREIYFWSFVVAVLLFAIGAGISVYQGIVQILKPEPVQHVAVNYVVLGICLLFDGTTWLLALRNFKAKEDFSQLLTSIQQSKDPPSFIVLLEDSASIVGILIATAGIYFSVRLALPVLDGVASVLIGLVMAATASLIGRETKSLLIGEAADQGIVDSITQLAGHMRGVMHVNGVLTVHLGPRQIIVALSLELADDSRNRSDNRRIGNLHPLRASRRFPHFHQTSKP